MEYACHNSRGVDVVRVLEREATLHEGVERFATDMLRLVRENGNSVVIDLSTVHYVDSAMVMTILGVLRELRSKGRELVLAGVRSASLQSTFTLSGIYRHVRQYETVDEAIAGAAMVYDANNERRSDEDDSQYRNRLHI